MVDFIFALSIICMLIFFVDIGELYYRYKSLIKDEKLINDFPSWKGTKKPKIWFVVWSIVLSLNIPFIIGLAFWLEDSKDFIILFVFAALYFLVYEIIYKVIRAIKKQQNKNKMSDN